MQKMIEGIHTETKPPTPMLAIKNDNDTEVETTQAGNNEDTPKMPVVASEVTGMAGNLHSILSNTKATTGSKDTKKQGTLMKRPASASVDGTKPEKKPKLGAKVSLGFQS